MDSSQVLQGSVETQSSESGWTMYIGSPMNGVDYGQYYSDQVEEGHGKVHYHGKYQGEESDDSMASDASSGPIRYCLELPKSAEYIPQMVQFETEKYKDEYYKSEKKAKKKNVAGEKRSAERRKEEKEEMVVMPRRANTATQSAAKLRTVWGRGEGEIGIRK